jgi:UDP-glucose 4-epimerase
MRSLITGGAGFIGSHLAEFLIERGDDVVVVDDLSTGRLENLDRVSEHPRFSFTQGNVRDEELVVRLVEEVDRVFHLAAAVGVMLIVERPVHTIETNIQGTEIVLRCAAKHGLPVLVASSSEVCGKGTGVAFEEEHDMVLGPTSRSRWSYAASKAVDEFLTLAYHRERGQHAVVARFFNTIGPRQVGQYGMVVPRFVSQALAGGPITVFGDGTQSRSFAFVGDVIRAIVKLIEEPAASGRVFNVGCDEEITIGGLAEKVREMVDPELEIVHVPYDEAYEEGFEDLGRRVPDLSRVREAIGYQPTLGLDEILKLIIEDIRGRSA